MLEQNQLVQLLPDFLTSEFLTIFLAKMIESDFAVTFSDGLDKPKNVILVDCSINHMIIKVPGNARQVCFSKHKGYNGIWKSLT